MTRFLLSPALKWIAAALLVALWLTVEALGWRDHAAAISGQAALTEQTVAYLTIWFTTVVFAPMLALGGIVQWFFERARTMRG